MSDTKRDPLKDQDILDVCERYADNYPCEGRITVNSMAMRRAVEPLVEAARAKDAELIQMLVDDLRLLRIEFGNRVGQTTEIGIASLSDAEVAGYKPSDQ